MKHLILLLLLTTGCMPVRVQVACKTLVYDVSLTFETGEPNGEAIHGFIQELPGCCNLGGVCQ